MAIESEVRARLATVQGPGGAGDVLSLGLVEGLSIRDGRVTFVIAAPAGQADAFEPVRAAAEAAVRDVPGVTGVTAVLTAERAAQAAAAPPAPPRLKPAAAHAPPPKGGVAPKTPLEGVAQIIAVASGKGGVGKSTTSVNLALALAAEGARVGILDADIYGPSMPRLLGASGKPVPKEGRIPAIEAHGIKAMSMGFLVDEEAPMVWRGPMVMSALTQMLRQVNWAPLDILVVDMPPGTGDAQLTLCQSVPLAGAIIVSTPQDIALIDARKGLTMFNKVDVPILGLVENMSYFLCPSCGSRADIFGHGGARAEAEALGVPFLGEVPLHMDIRRTSDSGAPIVASDPESAHAGAYRHIAQAVQAQLTRAAAPA